MPYVSINVTQEGSKGLNQVTAEQKAKLIKGVTDLLENVLDKDPNTTFVVIEETPLENWGVGGMPVAEYRQQKA